MLAVCGAVFTCMLLGWPEELVSPGALYGLSVLFMVTATPTGLLRLYDRFDLLAVQTNVGALARLAGAAAVFLAGGGITDFLLVWFAASVVARSDEHTSELQSLMRISYAVFC